MSLAMQGFSVGNVLGNGFRIWFKNLIPFLFITSVIYAPLLIWGITRFPDSLTLDELLSRASSFDRVVMISNLVLNLMVAAAVTYGVVMELQGSRASIGKCIGVGFGRFFPVLGVSILSVILVVLGFIAVIVPGIILICMFYVATPAAVIERAGVTGALGRSSELTKGHKWQIFGLVFLLGLLGWALQYTVNHVFMDPSTILKGGSLGGFMRRAIYLHIGLAVITTSLGAVMSATAYYFLRSEKEGTTADELARVFE